MNVLTRSQGSGRLMNCQPCRALCINSELGKKLQPNFRLYKIIQLKNVAEYIDAKAVGSYIEPRRRFLL